MKAVEERLRSAFSSTAGSQYHRQASGPDTSDRDRDDREPMGADAVRIDTALVQLHVLAGSALERVDGREAANIRDDLELADALAKALAAGQPIPATVRTPFVAELMLASDGTRPASLIRDGRLAAPALLGEFGDLCVRFLPDLASSIAATGRIMAFGKHRGSAVLVAGAGGEPLMITARHVVTGLITSGAVPGHAHLHVDFLGEVGSVGSARHVIAGMTAGPGQGWGTDFAVLHLGDALDGIDVPAPAPVDRDLQNLTPPARTAVISYPGRPDGVTRALASEAAWVRVFEGLFHVKRLSPAAVTDADPCGLVWHDATTTSGSSGGALLSIGTGRVAGIHLGGDGTDHNVALGLAACSGMGF